MFASDYTVGPAPRSKTTPPRPPALRSHRAYVRSPLDEDDLITPPDGTSFEIQIASSDRPSPRSGSQSYFQSEDEDDEGFSADRRLPPLGFSPTALTGKRRMSKGHASPIQAPSAFAITGSLSPTSSLCALPTPKAIEPLHVTPTKTGNRARSSYFPGSPRRPSLAPASSPRQSSPALGFDVESFWAGATPTSESPAVKPTLPAPVSTPASSNFTESLLAALAHETKAHGYAPTHPSKALHHFVRANDLLVQALEVRPHDVEAAAHLASITRTLARDYFSPHHAIVQCGTVIANLRRLIAACPRDVPPGHLVAARSQLASLLHLLATLVEQQNLSMIPRAIWAGETGQLAREAVSMRETVVELEFALMSPDAAAGAPSQETRTSPPGGGGKEAIAQRLREMRRASICNMPVTPESMVDGYLKLAEVAAYAAQLAADLLSSDRYFDIAESALESAASMASLTSGPLPKSPVKSPAFSFDDSPSSSPNAAARSPAAPAPPFVWTLPVIKVRLAVCQIKMARVRHSNTLGPAIPVNVSAVRQTIASLEALADDLGALPPASTEAAMRALAVSARVAVGEAQYALAHLLKRAWRRRASASGPGRKGSGSSTSSMRRSSSVEPLDPSSTSQQPARKHSSSSTASSIISEDLEGPVHALDPSAVAASPVSALRRASLEQQRLAARTRQGSTDPNTIFEEDSDEAEEDHDERVRRKSSVISVHIPHRASSVSTGSPIRKGSLAQVLEIRKASLPVAIPGRDGLPSSYTASPLSAGLAQPASPVRRSFAGGSDASFLRRPSSAPSLRALSIEPVPISPQRAAYDPGSASPLGSPVPSISITASQRRPSALSASLVDDDPLSTVPAPASTASPWRQRRPSAQLFPSSLSVDTGLAAMALGGPPFGAPPSPSSPNSIQYTSAELAEQTWELLVAAVANFKLALSLVKPALSSSSTSTAASSSSVPATLLPHASLQRAAILLSISTASYFRASLAGRVPAANESRTALLVAAEVCAAWAAREVGWDWLIDDAPCPWGPTGPATGSDGLLERSASDESARSSSTSASNASSSDVRRAKRGARLVGRVEGLGQRAVFSVMRTAWHKAVTGVPGEVHREEKRLAKERVERMSRRLRDETGAGAYDVTRFKIGIEAYEGEFEKGESLFWSGVTKTLKGETGVPASSR